MIIKYALNVKIHLIFMKIILVLKNVVQVIIILIHMNAKKNVYMDIMMIIIIVLYVKILINIMKMKFVLMNVHI